jgi:galactokinase
MSLDSMAERSAELFSKCFGRKPRWIVAAPGRVNLMGEHTDYNDGFVLPMAIELYTLMAGAKNAERTVTAHSVTTGETATFSIRPPLVRGQPAWSNYVRGVVAGFQKANSATAPSRVSGFDAVVDSTLPYGGGLASSAALEVATATLLEALTGRQLEPIEKALLCQQAEHDYAGVPCGLMDQFTSVLAQENHALLLDCRARTTTAVPMTDPLVTVLIINTQVRHKLADGEYARRRAQCELAAKALQVPALRDANLDQLEAVKKELDPVVFRRARHVLTENERTLAAAPAIQSGDWARVGDLMYASHASLRDDYQVSCAELDAIVDTAKTIPISEGMFGCRMTGAGFGGCAVSLVKTDAVKQVRRKIEESYEKKTRKHATFFSSRPAGGARIFK